MEKRCRNKNFEKDKSEVGTEIWNKRVWGFPSVAQINKSTNKPMLTDRGQGLRTANVCAQSEIPDWTVHATIFFSTENRAFHTDIPTELCGYPFNKGTDILTRISPPARFIWPGYQLGSADTRGGTYNWTLISAISRISARMLNGQFDPGSLAEDVQILLYINVWKINTPLKLFSRKHFGGAMLFQS